MQRRLVRIVLLVALLALTAGWAQAQEGGPTPLAPAVHPESPQAAVFYPITYQGRLVLDGSPASGSYDLSFAVYDAAHTFPYGTAVKENVTVSDGLFTVQLEFLDPMDVPTNPFKGQERVLEIGVRPGASTGSYTVLAPPQPVTPAPWALALPGLYTQATAGSPNIIGGYEGNFVPSTAEGAVIAGGGESPACSMGGEPCHNQVSGSFGVVGGGSANLAAARSVVAGGTFNHAGNFLATISGGSQNTADGLYATIGGGIENQALGMASSVPGGFGNEADGDYSFAAGYHARALHDGAFVWAGDTGANFDSVRDNQFLIRANGGVGINTTDTYTGGLTVNGRVIAGGTGSPAGSAEPFVSRGSVSGISLDDRLGEAYKRWVIYPRQGGLFFWNGSTRMGLDSTGILSLSNLAVGGSDRPVCLNNLNQVSNCASSSQRYKTDIASLPLGLETVRQLRPVSYRWKASGEQDLGLVAEEVAQVAPLLATHNPQGQVEGVKYERVNVVLVKAVQEQQVQIETLQAENGALRQQLTGIEARLAALEKGTPAAAGDRADAPWQAGFPWLLVGGLAVGVVLAARRRPGGGGR